MEESFSVGGSGTNGVVKLILETDSSISLWNMYDSLKLEFGILNIQFSFFFCYFILTSYFIWKKNITMKILRVFP